MATRVEVFNYLISYALQRNDETAESICGVYEVGHLSLAPGWSLCYELLPFMFDVKLGRLTDNSTSSVAIVVSPLVLITIDQAAVMSSLLY